MVICHLVQSMHPTEASLSVTLFCSSSSKAPLALSVLSPCFALQIIFHKQNPGIDYEFYVPVEKKDAEREKLTARERETPRHPPRERQRERESGRAPLRSMCTTFHFSDFPSCVWQLRTATPLLPDLKQQWDHLFVPFFLMLRT